jgi:hypothetical protein
LVFAVSREKKLLWRANTAEGKWDPDVLLPAIEPGGDPWAISDGTSLLLLVPVKDKGIAALTVKDPAELANATPQFLPESAGCEVSAALWKGSIVAILWRGPNQPLRASERAADGSFGAPRDLAGLMSLMPASAVEDPNSGEWLLGSGVTHKEGNQDKNQWRVSRIRRAANGGYEEVSSRIVGGPKAGWCGNSRPVLIFETSPTLGPGGRLHFMALGWTGPPNNNGCFWEAITIGDAAQDDGWRLRRFYDEWTTTRSPISAVWHNNDIAIAFRWFGNVHGDDDDNLLISHHGLGIDSQDMHDFDDVTHIAEVGLARSIGWRHSSIK